MASPSSQRPAPKFFPKVALVQLDRPMTDTVTRAFAPCGVHTVPVAEDFRKRFTTEQFQGCVVRLGDDAEAILEAVRSSRSNNRMILNGIVSRDVDMRRFFKYGLNAVLDLPLDRSAVLHVARSTSALLLHEMRRYIRIPTVVEVTVQSVGGKLYGSSREISSGGRSVAFTQDTHFDPGNLRLAFTLPEKPPRSIAAAPCWHNASQTGFQFQDSGPGRQTVKDWINSFLGLD
jgi:hypothetical protein